MSAPCFRYETWPTVLFIILEITRSFIDSLFQRAQHPWRNNKTNRRSSFNIWSVALWEICSSKISFYCCSAPFSVLSQIWRRQMCFFREHKTVSSRYHYAGFCCEHRFGITIWWQKYRSIIRPSVMRNTVYKCYAFQTWSV